MGGIRKRISSRFFFVRLRKRLAVGVLENYEFYHPLRLASEQPPSARTTARPGTASLRDGRLATANTVAITPTEMAINLTFRESFMLLSSF